MEAIIQNRSFQLYLKNIIYSIILCQLKQNENSKQYPVFGITKFQNTKLFVIFKILSSFVKILN